MSAKANKALVRRLYAAFNSRDLDELDELIAVDVVDHTPGSEQVPGITGIKQAWESVWTRFPDIRAVEEDVLADGDKVATRVVFQRHSSTHMKAPAIGMMMEIVRIADGKVADVWNIIKFE